MEPQTEALQRVEGGAIQQLPQSECLTVAEVINQKKVVNDLLRNAMTDGVHYGKIPGCGDKPALLKPGAEKIGFTFRLAPEFQVQKKDLQGGHYDVMIICTLRNIVTGQSWGQG